MVLSEHERKKTCLPRVAPVFDKDDPEQDESQIDQRYELRVEKLIPEARDAMAQHYDGMDPYVIESLFEKFSDD
eukprot:SAG31_NODE_13696_length_852_cov_1.727756_1_plen_73_part_10